MSSRTPSHVRTFIASAKRTLSSYGSRGDTIGQEIQRILELLEPLPTLSGWFPRSDHDITRQIGATIRSGSEMTMFLLDSITPIIRFLPWRDGDATREDAPDLRGRIAFAEIVGPAAPFVSKSVCLGLALIAPDTRYPAHHHSASELYYVVTGTATWVINGVPKKYSAGSFILHSPQAVHAIQTGFVPLLALYTWGDPNIRAISPYTGNYTSGNAGSMTTVNRQGTWHL